MRDLYRLMLVPVAIWASGCDRPDEVVPHVPKQAATTQPCECAEDAVDLATLRAQAEAGDVESLIDLGDHYYNGIGVERDVPHAVGLYRQAADQGAAIAQWRLALVSLANEAETANEADAAHWCQLAAAQGHPEAQYAFSRLLKVGRGVPQDLVAARRWERTAAENGHAEAQYNLGVAHDEGHGMREDNAEAVKWYSLAADQGHASAAWNLGIMYENGEGVPVDTAKATALFLIAAGAGHVEAYEAMGYAYAAGVGVTPDKVHSYYWYGKAVHADGRSAELYRKNLKILASEMYESDLRLAEEMLRADGIVLE